MLEWLRVLRNAPKFWLRNSSKIIKYASEWLKMVENGLKHLKMVQNVSNAWKWINITEMGEMDEAPHPHEIEGLKAQKKNKKTKLVKI